MSKLSDHVEVLITRVSTGIARAGFGTPMILGYSATFPERLRYYSDISGLTDDGFATDSPEYLAAQAMFEQQPHVSRIAVGKGLLPPTLTYVISVAAVRASHHYTVNVRGRGVTTTTVDISSDSSPLNDEIVGLLVTALNGVTGANYTATATGSSGSQVVTITANAAGSWFSLDVGDVADLGIKMTHADPGVATDLAAIRTYQPDWYALYTLFNSKLYVQAAAADIQANGRIYLPDVPETDAINTSTGSGDTIDALHTSAYSRVMAAYHPRPWEMFGAAWLGRVLNIPAGSENWKFKRLVGPSAPTLTTTQRTNLTNKKGNGYENVGGLNMTFEGSTADGDFLDATRGDDWIVDDMQKGVLEALSGPDKVEYEDSGVALVTAAMRATLDRAVVRKILRRTPKPVVNAPLVADIADVDRGERTLPDLKFSGQRAGSINKAKISGTVAV
jgi:hypothetical protein